ncbi:hypothetical protein IID22_01135 [Patescibacteria group bacterium]|nr:hypothetical protein [Patescibacteria group bacterium]
MLKKNGVSKALGISGLSKRQQDELLKFIRKGESDGATKVEEKEGREAKKILAIRCQSTVRSVASKYIKSTIPLDELIRTGNRGLAHAIRVWNWRPKKKRRYKFTTYATWFIRAEIHKKLGLPVDVEGYGELRKKKQSK